MKIRPVRAELYHTDKRTEGQKYTTKLIFAFRDLLTSLKPEQGEENKFIHYSPQEVSKHVPSPTLLSESEKKKNNIKIRYASHVTRQSCVDTSTTLHAVNSHQTFSIFFFYISALISPLKYLKVSNFKLLRLSKLVWLGLYGH
jgi:hypothetical protein